MLESARGQPTVLPQGAWAGKPLAVPFPKMLDTGAAAWQTEAYLGLIREEYLKEHTVPLWNPYQGYGTPLAANMHSQPFYPLTMALILRLNPHTYNWFIFLRLFIAGFCAYLYIRFFVSFLPAVAGGITSMLGGYYVLFCTMPHISVECLLPPGLLAAEYFLRHRTYKTLAVFSLLILLIMLGGMPESALFLLSFLYVYMFFRAVTDTPLRSTPLLLIGRLATATIIGFALSAFLLMPFHEYMKIAFDWHQPGNIGGTISGLLHDPRNLSVFTYLFPLLFGTPFTNTFGPYLSGLRNYIGLIAVFLVLLSLLGVWSGRKTGGRHLRLLTWFYFCTAVVIVLKRYGVAPVNYIGLLPFFQLAQFPKYEEVILSVSVSMLCAIALERVLKRQISLRLMGIALALTSALVPVTIIFSRNLLSSEVVNGHVALAIPLVALGVPVCLLFGLATCLIFAASSERSKGEPAGWRLAASMLVLLTAETCGSFLIPVYYSFDRIASQAANPYAGAPYIRFLQTSDHRNFRVFGLDSVLFPNWASAFGIQDIRDLDAMYYKRYLPFVRNFIPASVVLYAQDTIDRFTGVSHYDLLDPLQRRLLSLSSVKYLLTMHPLPEPNGIVDEILRQNRDQLRSTGYVQLSRQDFALDGPPRDELGQYPPYNRLPFRLSLRDHPKSMHFEYALNPVVFQYTATDGAEFTIEVKQENGKISKVFSRYIDPKHNPAERHWMSGDIDLSKYRGSSITLLLSTNGGPKGDIRNDWTAWSNFYVSGGDAKPVDMFKLVYDAEAKVYEFDRVLPRAALFFNAEVKAGDKAVLQKLADPSLDIFQSVVLDRAALSPAELSTVADLNQNAPTPVQPARILSYRSDSVTVEASPDRAAILMLNDSDYPGWEVTVDGRPAHAFTVDYLFRGLLLAPGKHLVRFKYEPASFRIGMMISAAAAIVLFLLGFVYPKLGIDQESPTQRNHEAMTSAKIES
jgi:small-conductance mechanosensitive channel